MSAVLKRWEQAASIDSRWQQMNVVYCHGANRALLKRFYDCSQAEFGKLRAENHCWDLRKKRLQEAEDIAFYQLWKSQGCRNDIKGLLSLSGDTGYALSLIWPLIQEWLETEQHFSACQTSGRRQA